MSILKSFSKSTILGLIFGVLLVGYGVFAYTPPTQTPTGGNVAAPLNTGSGDQTKIGGLLSVFDLWVNQSLGVTGGATFGGTVQIGNSASSLPCDSSKKGTFYFNTNIEKVSVCTGTAWEIFSTGVDFDEDGVIAGIDCDDGNINIWQNLTGYADGDSDGHFISTSPETVCSGSSLPSNYSLTAGDDCNDSCPTCYPGSSATTASVDGLDQDCDGTIDENIARGSATCGGSVIPVCYNNLDASCNDYCGGSGSWSGGGRGPMGGNIEIYDWSSCSGSGNIYCFGWNIGGSGGFQATCSCTPMYQ